MSGENYSVTASLAKFRKEYRRIAFSSGSYYIRGVGGLAHGSAERTRYNAQFAVDHQDWLSALTIVADADDLRDLMGDCHLWSFSQLSPALHLAVLRGDDTVVRILVASGIAPCVRCHGLTALELAVAMQARLLKETDLSTDDLSVTSFNRLNSVLSSLRWATHCRALFLILVAGWDAPQALSTPLLTMLRVRIGESEDVLWLCSTWVMHVG